MAQNNSYKVSGHLKDQAGESLTNAIVVFKNIRDTTQLYPAVCDIKGYFRQELPQGRYRFLVSYLGERYYPQNNAVTVSEKEVELPPIVIKLRSQQLDEVVVVSRCPFVSYKGSNAVYNPSANPAAVSETLLDGIKLLPGVQVNENDSLSIFGFYNLTVAVNGQILRLSNNEVHTYLASLGIANVESVELIRNPGPEYGTRVDAVLNIITKKKPNEGFNAFLSADISYQALLSVNSRVRLNYNKGNTRNYLAYQYFDNRRKETLTTSIGANTTSVNPYRRHGIQIGSEWQVSPRHLIGVRSYLTLSDERLEYNTSNRIDMDRKVGTVNLFHSSSGKRWSWNNYADYTFSLNRRDYFHNSAINGALEDRYHYFRIATDFLFRFTSTISTRFGGIRNDSRFDTMPQDSPDGKSNSYKESSTFAYLSLRYRKEAVDTYAGVQLNYDQRDNHWIGMEKSKADAFLNWQSYLSFSYDFSRKHRFSTMLQTYYKRPSFRDLMPYVSSSSGFLSREGNPDLKNSTRYNLSLSYTYLRAAMLEVSLSDEKNPIIEYLKPHKGGYTLAKTNLENSRYLRLVAGAPIPLIYRENGLQWFASIYLAYHLQQDRGIVNAADYNRLFNAYYVQHKQSLNLPAQWYFDAGITYYSPLFVGVYKTEKQWWVDFTLSKRMGSWKFSLTGYDLFNTNIARGEIVGMNTPISFSKNSHSPKLTFGVSYTFGNKELKSSIRKSVNGESRLNQSADESISVGSGK